MSTVGLLFVGFRLLIRTRVETGFLRISKNVQFKYPSPASAAFGASEKRVTRVTSRFSVCSIS